MSFGTDIGGAIAGQMVRFLAGFAIVVATIAAGVTLFVCWLINGSH